MSTIQELIDNGKCVLGKTKIQSKKWYSRSWVKVYFKDADSQEWICQDSIGDTCDIPYPRSDFQVYVEPVEMEDRWLWADLGSSSLFPRLISYGFFTENDPQTKNKTKLEWSKTQFPKEKNS
jgi:hypothetical protein